MIYCLLNLPWVLWYSGKLVIQRSSRDTPAGVNMQVWLSNHCAANRAVPLSLCAVLPMPYCEANHDLTIGPNCLGSPATTSWPEYVSWRPLFQGKVKNKTKTNLKQSHSNYVKHHATHFIYLQLGLNIQSLERALHCLWKCGWNDCACLWACRGRRVKTCHPSAMCMRDLSYWSH